MKAATWMNKTYRPSGYKGEIQTLYFLSFTEINLFLRRFNEIKPQIEIKLQIGIIYFLFSFFGHFYLIEFMIFYKSQLVCIT